MVTVRSAEKGDQILRAHPSVSRSSLSYVLARDIAADGAFDEAVQSDPPFEAVLHTASPFHYKPVDVQRDLIAPAVNGTLNLLKAVHKFAPTITKVIITSSFAAVISPHEKKARYTDTDWNPVTIEEALQDNVQAYRASKTFAEKAAWDFVYEQKPNFSIASMCPPLILGPVIQSLSSLDSINTSSERIRDLLQGKWRERLAPSQAFYWIDVRDVALAHVKAMEIDSASGKRYILTAGSFSNADIARAAFKAYPELRSEFPMQLESDKPSDLYECDTTLAKEVLGLKFRSLEESIADSIRSLKALGL